MKHKERAVRKQAEKEMFFCLRRQIVEIVNNLNPIPKKIVNGTFSEIYEYKKVCEKIGSSGFDGFFKLKSIQSLPYLERRVNDLRRLKNYVLEGVYDD